MTNESPKLAKLFSVGGIIFALLLLLGGIGYFAYKNLSGISSKNTTPQVEISVPESQDNVFINDVSGVQPASEQATLPSSVSQSEHYALREITFGGVEVDMSGEAKNIPLTISDVKGETMISKDGKNTNLLFSWKTNKLATSEVTYAKNDGPIKNTLSEQGPGLSHALILNFEPATRYTYFITAKDHWGNVATSEKFSAYTSIKSDNVVDLIAQQFKQIFSWLNIK
jgi:hypothetical protein